MNISIACVTETWFQKKNGTFSKRIRDAGFTLHHSFRENKRGGGCAIMYKKHLLVKKGDSSSTEYFHSSMLTLFCPLCQEEKLL